MYFRVTYQLKSIYLTDREKIEFSVAENEDGIIITLENIPKEELKKGDNLGELRCNATLEKDLSDVEIEYLESNKSKIEENLIDSIASIEKRLRELVERTIYSYRWLRGITNAHNPIKYRFGMFYSLDKKEWKPVHGASKVSMTIKFDPGMQIVNLEFISALQKSVEKKENEPLGHELFAEAWELRRTNPRSSLIIGVAALEAGFKEFVSILVPDANWLVENAPTPPLVTMLKHYLPKLPCKAKIKGKVIAPPKKLLNIINDGVELRNKVAHGRRKDVNLDDLEILLGAIRDVLYLLDVYTGRKWAVKNISGETVEELCK